MFGELVANKAFEPCSSELEMSEKQGKMNHWHEISTANIFRKSPSMSP